MIYTQQDMLQSGRRLRKCALVMAAVLLPLLGLYIAAIAMRMAVAALVVLLAMYCWCLLAGDLMLAPARRYHSFLRQMNGGLRRSVNCELVHIDEEQQMQDGVRVYGLLAALCDGGDGRIYYINASKLKYLPPMGSRVRLTSWGRHVLEFTDI